MTGTYLPQLSKSKFLSGLQCLKRLYLETYHPELLLSADHSQQAPFDSGTAVGVLARDLFPGGRLVSEDFSAHQQAVEQTQGIIKDQSVPSIYEAGFTFDGIRTSVDILKRLSRRGFALAEVKSSTSVKPEYIPDAAIQTYVAEGSDILVRNIFLIHINSSYV